MEHLGFKSSSVRPYFPLGLVVSLFMFMSMSFASGRSKQHMLADVTALVETGDCSEQNPILLPHPSILTQEAYEALLKLELLRHSFTCQLIELRLDTTLFVLKIGLVTDWCGTSQVFW